MTSLQLHPAIELRPRPTPSEWRCLKVIARLMKKYAWAPTQKEIAQELGVTTGAIGYLIAGLEGKAYLTRDRNKPRSLILLVDVREDEQEIKNEGSDPCKATLTL